MGNARKATKTAKKLFFKRRNPGRECGRGFSHITGFTNRNDADASGTSHRPSLDEPSHNSRANPNLGEPSRRAIHHAIHHAIHLAIHHASTLG